MFKRMAEFGPDSGGRVKVRASLGLGGRERNARDLTAALSYGRETKSCLSRDGGAPFSLSLSLSSCTPEGSCASG